MQESARDLQGFAEDQLGAGGIKMWLEGNPPTQQSPRKGPHPLILVNMAHLDQGCPQACTVESRSDRVSLKGRAHTSRSPTKDFGVKVFAV